MTTAYIVAGVGPWSRRAFDEIIARFSGAWHFVATPDALMTEWVATIRPRYLFFIHWSWKVPEDIVSSYECVGFHMTDLPYGRGGSPLQNLVVRGHRTTKLTALRLTSGLDAGPVYLKEDLSLEGDAEEIYLRMSRLAARMIDRIIGERIVPVPQTGEVATFKRRTPAESEIPGTTNLIELYDFIRMLDAEGYPRAFLIHEGFRYEFSRAALGPDGIVADVRITPVKQEGT